MLRKLEQYLEPELLLPRERVAHNLPSRILSEDLESFAKNSEYFTEDVWLKQFRSVLVSPKSVAYKSFKIIPETLMWDVNKKYYQFNHLFSKILTHKRINLNKFENYLLLTNAWSSNHYHWFCEVLPKLLCLKNVTKEYTLLLPDTPYIRSMGIRTIERLGIIFKNIILMKEDEVYFAKKFSLVTPLAQTGGFVKDVMLELRNRMVVRPGNAERRVYLSRKKSERRKVLNELEVSAIMRSFGFEIVYAEEMGLEEQIDLFSNCSFLAGIHGAGLVNALFMNPGGSVLEIRKKEIKKENVLFWHQSDIMGHHYHYFNGIPDLEKPIIGSNCNISVPVKPFTNLLSEIL